jgi:hypothetical protein
MKLISFLFIFFLYQFPAMDNDGQEDFFRYILIEAPCEANFNALPEYPNKVILTKVFKAEFENAIELVNAEQELIVRFEVALDKAYPNSRNQVKDIMVYMLTNEKEAKELLNRKKKQFETLDTGVIELKVK